MLHIRVGGTGNLLVEAKPSHKSFTATPPTAAEAFHNFNPTENVSTQFVNDAGA